MEHERRRTINGQRYLSFGINGEDYCITIAKVREILEMIPITYLPYAPPFIKGIVNLRGRMVPIIDLRTKFGMPFLEYNERTCIIIVDLSTQAEQVLMGVVVDTISEVVGIPDEQISQVEYVNAQIQSTYIKGIAEFEKGIQIILDMDRVLSVEEFKILSTIKNNAIEGKEIK